MNNLKIQKAQVIRLPMFKFMAQPLQMNLILESSHKKIRQRVWTYHLSVYQEVMWICSINTVAINELLCMKNVGAQIAMDFS